MKYPIGQTGCPIGLAALMTAYIDRALQAAMSAKRMRDDGDQNGACSRANYAMFYAVHGLLEPDGADNSAKTHASILRLFSQHFVMAGKAPSELARALAVAQNLRSKADYSVRVPRRPMLPMRLQQCRAF